MQQTAQVCTGSGGFLRHYCKRPPAVNFSVCCRDRPVCRERQMTFPRDMTARLTDALQIPILMSMRRFERLYTNDYLTRKGGEVTTS